MNVDHIKRDKLSQIQLRIRLDEQSVLVEKYTIDSGDVTDREFCILHKHKEEDESLLVKIDYIVSDEKGEKIKLSTPRVDKKKGGKKWGFYPKKEGRLIITKKRIAAYMRLFRKSFYTTFRTVEEMLGMAENAVIQDVNIKSGYKKYSTINPNIGERYIITIAEE